MSYFSLKNGEQLYYEDTGSGDETIVMLHGWVSSRRVFAPAIPAIRRAARCITYDQRGHGKSRDANRGTVTMDTLAEDLQELITGLGLRDITLLGWSMGAGVVLNYTARYGCGALRRIVLCDMSPRQMNDAEWRLGLYQGRFTQRERAEGEEFYPLYREFAVGAVPRLAKLPDFLVKILLKRRLAACDMGVVQSLAWSMLEQDLRPCVEEITVPVHYFCAVPGSLYSPELADWYRAHVRGPFHAAAFPNSTHMLVTDHPARFAREVVRVLGDRSEREENHDL